MNTTPPIGSPRRRLIVNIAIAIDIPEGMDASGPLKEALDFVNGPPGQAHRVWTTSDHTMISAYRTSKWEKLLPPLEREGAGQIIAAAEQQALTSAELRQ